MGNVAAFICPCPRRGRSPVDPSLSGGEGIATGFALVFLLLFTSPAIPAAFSAEPESGIAIYTTLDHGRDETAIAVPFVKAERFQFVTNVTTRDGKVIRVTNSMMKEIVRPPDLTTATVVDEVGIQSLKREAGALRALQRRFPAAAAVLDSVTGEIDRTVQALDEGNVLHEGRLMAKADYESRMAASRMKTVDLELDGRVYGGARVTAVVGDQVSITHGGGVIRVTVDRLSDEQIARLNGTSDGGPVLDRNKMKEEALAMQEEARRREERMNLEAKNENLENENERLRKQVELFRQRPQGGSSRQRPHVEFDDGMVDGTHLRSALFMAAPHVRNVFMKARERMKISQRRAAEGKYLDPSPTKEEIVIKCKRYLEQFPKDKAVLESLLENASLGLGRTFDSEVTFLKTCGLSEAEARLCLISLTLFAAHEAADEDY